MDKEQALEGVKVLEFTRVIVGPHTTRMLAEHGATVIRVESMHHPDFLRVVVPYKDGVSGLDRSGYYAKYNINKYSAALNLEKPKAVDVFKRLAKWSDIVIDSNAPGVMDRLGIGYQELKKINPRLIFVSTSQLGQTGPWASFKAFGVQSAAMAGFHVLTGYPDQDPPGPYGAYTDLLSPQWIVCALVAALAQRRRTGKGFCFDHSQLEAGAHFLATTIMDYAVNGRVAHCAGNRDRYAAPHGCYRCRGDDQWCVIAVFTDEEWRSFIKLIGEPTWAQDARFATLLGRKANEDELDRLVEEWTIEQTPWQVMNTLQQAGVPAAVVATSEDMHNDPQLKARGFWQILDHREMGPVAYSSPPFKLSKTPWQAVRPSPCLGEHNEYIYKEILAMPEDEYVQLLLDGVFE